MNIEALRPLSGITPMYPAQLSQPEVQAVKQFAESNGFTFSLNMPTLVEYSWRDYKTTPAWMGMAGIGATKEAYNVVSGDYMGYHFSMFLKWEDILDGSGYQNPTPEQKLQYVKQQTSGIVRIKLPKTFPQIVLDSGKNDRMSSSIGTAYDSSQRLHLEGDFDNYFDLYAPIGLQVNVLTVLAPNMMQILKNHAGLFDVEFYNDELIIMTNSNLYDPVVMEALIAAMSEQLIYLDRLLTSWNYTPLQQPTDLLVKPFITGKVIKIGNFRLSPAVQIISVFSIFIFVAIVFNLLPLFFYGL